MMSITEYSTYNTINYKIILNYFYKFLCYFLGKWTEQRQRLWPNLQSGKTQTIQRHWFFIAQSMLIPNLLLLGSIMGIRSKITKSFRYDLFFLFAQNLLWFNTLLAAIYQQRNLRKLEPKGRLSSQAFSQTHFNRIRFFSIFH